MCACRRSGLGTLPCGVRVGVTRVTRGILTPSKPQDAGSALDWGYVCTACACPCVQFYINWKKMLTGAPEQRFYCLSGPCCECSDSVHACCQTVCCVAFYPLISLKVRGLIRANAKIGGSAAKDLALICCCPCFALAQEGRQLDAKPFRGGDIVLLPSWRRCFKSCGIPLRKRDERLLGSLHLRGPCPAGAGRMRAR